MALVGCMVRDSWWVEEVLQLCKSMKIMIILDEGMGGSDVCSSFSVGFSGPVRGLDSFAAFEEMFIVAKKHQVDFVLLGESDQE